MKFKLVGAAFSAALLMGPGQALAATVTFIDDFNTPQIVSDVPASGQTNGSQVADSSAIGGYRELHVRTANGGESGTLGSVHELDGEGVLSFSNASTVRGEGWITWDGIGTGFDPASYDRNDPSAGAGINKNGLGGIDLTGGFAQAWFDFDVITADHQLEFTFNVWDIDGGFSTYFEVLPPIEELETRLMFSEFTGDAKFTQVGALQIYVRSPDGVGALDATIGSIRVEAVPLPASALLLLGGLGGLAGLRTRRRKAA